MTPEITSIYFPEVQFTNESENTSNLLWDFGTGDTTSVENPLYLFTNHGEWDVMLTAWNENGCTDEVTHVVTITNEFNVYVPNTFTPNGDGLNDVFKPEFITAKDIEFYKLSIFNRWGEVIFETTDPMEAWSGNVRGGDYFTDSGVYTYQLLLKMTDSVQKKIFTGHVTMNR